MRYLAIDLGDKRTGLAVGDDSGLVLPVDVVEVSISADGGRALLRALERAVRDHLGEAGPGGGELVVGLPLNMDGTEGSRAKLVRSVAQNLANATRRAVHLHDERLSSASADWTMAQSGLTHGQKKARRDALAAAAILRDFLTARNTTPRNTDASA